MAIYSITNESITPIKPTTFAAEGIGERSDIQRMLRDRIEIVSPDTLVIAEEFGEWEDSRRRIDLLGVDKDANIVVVELKRTEDGGHMELQAIRYAAMVSTLTFDKVVEVFARYLRSRNDDRDALQTLLSFLGWEEPNEEDFAQDTRIVLASVEFSKELTTAVLWLSNYGIDIRCVRIKPYGTRDNLLLDVQQVIPLPEAEDYQIRVREKHQQQKRSGGKDYTKYTVIVNGERFEKLAKNRAVLKLIKSLVDAGHSPSSFKDVMPWRTYFIRAFDGILSADEAANKASEANWELKRWFLSEDEIIHADGRTWVLSSQWGKRTEEALRTLLDHCNPKNIKFERYE